MSIISPMDAYEFEEVLERNDLEGEVWCDTWDLHRLTEDDVIRLTVWSGEEIVYEGSYYGREMPGVLDYVGTLMDGGIIR